MKSVCIVVQGVYDFDPRVRRKAEALVAAGYTVDVLALRPSSGDATYRLNGVNIITVSLGKKRGSLARYLFEYAVFFLWVLFKLPMLMRRRRYAVVDVNTLPDFLIFAAIVARWMGAKLVLDMHEITPEFYMSKYGIARNSWLVRALEYTEKISFDFADRVVTINEPILELLVSRGLSRSKTIVVMNAVDEARFSVSSNAPAPVDRPEFVMVYHGTLTRIYGLDIAIEAFAMAHRDMPGAELWILGSGPEQQPLALLAQTRGVASAVKLIGQVPASDIPGWLNRCDVGILPIRSDVFLEFAFPNKLPEFIIARKAVLVSRLRAMRHYFTEDAVAFCEPNSPEDLAEQMKRLYGDRRLRAALVNRAGQEYEPIRWDVMKQRYVALIATLAGPVYEPVQSNRASTTDSQVTRDYV